MKKELNLEEYFKLLELVSEANENQRVLHATHESVMQLFEFQDTTPGSHAAMVCASLLWSGQADSHELLQYLGVAVPHPVSMDDSGTTWVMPDGTILQDPRPCRPVDDSAIQATPSDGDTKANEAPIAAQAAPAEPAGSERAVRRAPRLLREALELYRSANSFTREDVECARRLADEIQREFAPVSNTGAFKHRADDLRAPAPARAGSNAAGSASASSMAPGDDAVRAEEPKECAPAPPRDSYLQLREMLAQAEKAAVLQAEINASMKRWVNNHAETDRWAALQFERVAAGKSVLPRAKTPGVSQ